ncbi:hypothetical protein BHM03_00046474 [Ensete ventricosum]|nr:hypothetical protein BHM03_00046474 [Ensete ventricosum]
MHCVYRPVPVLYWYRDELSMSVWTGSAYRSVPVLYWYRDELGMPVWTEQRAMAAFVRAAAAFALGTLIDVGSVSFGDGHGGDEDFDDDEKIKSELNIVRNLIQAAGDGSPLVRAEVAVGMCSYQNFLSAYMKV